MERKCMMCGAELGEREKYCGNCGAIVPDGAAVKEDVQLKFVKKDVKSKFSWGWHGVYCNFIIILQSIGLVLSGILGMLNMSRQVSSYPAYVMDDPSAKVLVTAIYIFSILYILLGAFGFVTRHFLANFHKFGVESVLIFTGCGVAFPFLLWLVTVMSVPGSTGLVNLIKSILVPSVMLFTNMVYYLKRIDVYQ